ncbi:MAG: aminopeptidase P family protein [Alphaproteobacteria bacterium]|nr:aminopeptidase P family protein [Alphaproteobacteria bacterium]
MKIVVRFAILSFACAMATQAAAAERDVFQARRDALMEMLDGRVAVLYGAPRQIGGATELLFIQESNFYYLTGISEPGAALILAPKENQYKEILYLQPRNPDKENWDGRRAPLGDALEKATGFPEVRRIGRLGGDLTGIMQRSKRAAFLGPIVSATADMPPALSILRDGQSKVPGTSLENMADLIPEMRRIKDAYEIERIQKAVDVTGKGLVAAMQSVAPGMQEFQLQSIVDHTYEMEGAQFLGFSTILAWGPNTTVLHYTKNDQAIQDAGLVLIDTGAAWEHYSADVTRTIPASGVFSDRERELYELVLKASNAAIKKVRSGANYYNDVHMTAKNILDEAGYGEYFIHGTGHFVGLDVHDAGNYDLPLKPGVVVTVEPGIYIPEEGIGIRIEDVVLVTKGGPVILSRRIPRTIEEIESVMAK